MIGVSQSMSWIENFSSRCHSQLQDSVREALWCRGVSDDQMDLYRVGYIDGILPPGPEYPEGFLEWSSGGSKLKDCFVLPLTDMLGEVKGLQFRAVSRDQKGYMDFFVDRSQAVLFGLGQAAPYIWETGRVCLVEGAFDLFPVQRIRPYVVSTLTARASDQLVRALLRVVKHVYLLFDDDAGGHRGRDKFVKYHGHRFETVSLDYPIGVVFSNGVRVKDPAELWEAWGDERMGSFLQPQMR